MHLYTSKSLSYYEKPQIKGVQEEGMSKKFPQGNIII